MVTIEISKDHNISWRTSDTIQLENGWTATPALDLEMAADFAHVSNDEFIQFLNQQIKDLCPENQ